MAENPSNFVRDWISDNVRHDPSFDGNVKARVEATMDRLIADSRAAEIPQDDPELAMDLLSDLFKLRSKRPKGLLLERAHDDGDGGPARRGADKRSCQAALLSGPQSGHNR